MIANIEEFVARNHGEHITDEEVVDKMLEMSTDLCPAVRIKDWDTGKTFSVLDFTTASDVSHAINAVVEHRQIPWEDDGVCDTILVLYEFARYDDNGNDLWTSYVLVDGDGEPLDIGNLVQFATERIQALHELEAEERRNPRREPHESFPPTRHTWTDNETGEERVYYSF